jgi:hypothetical protein
MNNFIFWIYLINATFLICHEIDSAYWKEWELLRLPGKITGFLIIHLVVIFLVLLGLVKTFQGLYAGYIYSLFLGLSGIAAFTIHTVFICRGRTEFKTPISLFILISTFTVSLVQVGVAVFLMLI